MCVRCSPDKLCDDCLEALFGQLRGVAERRGEQLAMTIAEKRGRHRSQDRDLVLALARVRLTDITTDRRLLYRLAEPFTMRFEKTMAERGLVTTG